MRAQVSSQLPLLPKCLITLIAYKWFVPRVRAYMLKEMAVAGKLFVAVRAQKLGVFCVAGQVLGQLLTFLKRFFTMLARK